MPSQWKIRLCAGKPVVGSADTPTAQTSEDEIASTSLTKLLVYGPGFGVGITFQLVPSQCIASVFIGPGLNWPIAHTSLDGDRREAEQFGWTRESRRGNAAPA